MHALKTSFQLFLSSLLFCLFSCAHHNRLYTLRLKPGDDVKIKLEEFVKVHKLEAVSIVTAVGSLTQYNLRFANQSNTTTKTGHFEIVSFTGLLGVDNCHLHLSVSDDKGMTVGGHMKEGNIVYTTLEITLIEDHQSKFIRVDDTDGSGYKELKVLKR